MKRGCLLRGPALQGWHANAACEVPERQHERSCLQPFGDAAPTRRTSSDDGAGVGISVVVADTAQTRPSPDRRGMLVPQWQTQLSARRDSGNS